MPAKVFLFQPSIQHYRLPVWDGIVQRGSGLYEFTALGPMENGQAFGGGSRSYLRETTEVRLRIPGIPMFRWPEAIEIVQRERPDVVMMASNPRNVSCWTLPKACKAIGAAVVGHTKVHSSTGGPAFLTNPVRRRFYNRLDFIICYGEQSRRELLALGYPANQSRVAQNTIDTRRIFEQAPAIEKRSRELRAAAKLLDKKILLCIGRMEPDKRHDDLLRAWPRLRQLDPKLVMVLVSGGPLLNEIKAKARSIDPHRIVVTGRVPEGDDYAWIAAADITIYPGAVGLAINQSLALGRPTIIADESGADAEILEHDKTGWRYPRGDLAALVQTVKSAMHDESARKIIAENARILMRDRVTIDNMADAFHATILEALELSRVRKSSPQTTLAASDEPG